MCTILYIVDDTEINDSDKVTIEEIPSSVNSPRNEAEVSNVNEDKMECESSEEPPFACFNREKSVYRMSVSSLPSNQIVKIMEDYVSGRIDCFLTRPPLNPVGGEIYVYKLKDPNDREYLYDKLPFNQTAKKAFRGILRVYYFLRNPRCKETGTKYLNGFSKIVYRAGESNFSKDIVIIHYLGDRKIFDYIVSSEKRKWFLTKKKHQIDDVATAATLEHANCEKKNVGKNIILTENSERTTDNTQKAVKIDDKQLRRCEIFSILELQKEEFGRFITDFHVNNDYTCVVCTDTVAVELVNHLLQLTRENDDLGQFLSYETALKMRGFFVSIVSARNVKFKDDPAFPVAFLVHNNNEESVHELFWSIMVKKLNIKECGKEVPLCIERCENVRTAITNVFPNCQVIVSHEYMEQEAANWLKRKTVKQPYRDHYEKHIKDLLLATSEDEFNSKYDDYSATWFKPFLEYVEDFISDLKHSALYKISHYPAFKTAFPTDDIRERLNNALKIHVNLEELPLDELILSLYDFQMIFLRDFQLGEREVGQLKPLFKRLPFKSKSNLSCDAKLTRDARKYLENKLTVEKDFPSYRSTARRLAEVAIKEGLVSLDAVSRSFVVRSCYGSKKYLVNVSKQGNESCSCTSSGVCYHIIAVYLAMGRDPPTGNEDDHTYELNAMLMETESK